MDTATTRAPTNITLRGVTYDVYATLRDDPRNNGVRMTYRDGALEFMSPEFRHDRAGRRVAMVVRACAAAFRLECQGAGSTTFRSGSPGQLKGLGKEPDESFYFANAPRVRSKERIDLRTDPPPDLWVEVDNRVKSKGRLPVYAALGIPEVWCYRARKHALWFGALEGGGYKDIDRSLSLPMLTPAVVLDLLAEADRLGETEWDIWMRGWMGTGLERPGH